MKFCDRHWTMMREAVEARGMTPLVSTCGEVAVAQLRDEIERGTTLDNFDPLMALHWNIAGNLMDKLGRSAGYLLSGGPDGPEDPIDIMQISDPALQAKYAGHTWPRCPICYCNITHELTCRERGCRLDRVNGWDVCIGWAADGVRKALDDMLRKQSKRQGVRRVAN